MKRESEKSVQTAEILCFHFLLLALLFPLVSCSRASQASDERPTPDPLKSVAAGPYRDSDSDGIPNGAELTTAEDRANFRRWFTAIAETQFYELSQSWTTEQRDCAGLVRFALRESLRRHDRQWIKAVGGFSTPIAPDVGAFSLTEGLLGERLFRLAFGTFRENDLQQGRFSEFADARTLKNYNSTFIGKDRHLGQPGDLLFFHQPWVQRYPYHVMIFLGPAREAGDGAADWVVYHTGASPDDDGVVKKVRLAVLDHHPNRRWRPVDENVNFLGFYRLKILD